MRTGLWLKLAVALLPAVVLANCGPGSGEVKVDIEEILARPKTYVGSEQCQFCHLEHYDSWKTTLHSRTIQDVTQNQDALIAEIDPEAILADLKNQQTDLKVPADQVYIPKVEEIKYTIGMQWKQGFLIKKNGELYVAPVEYDARSERWISYHEADWDQRPWDNYCGGCHAMGVDIQKHTLIEPRVGCEACHGPGSHHLALPEKAVFDKRLTIVNPSQLPAAFRTQICGSCLGRYFETNNYDQKDIKSTYAEEFAKGHGQQYIEWLYSSHAKEGVTCTSCHYVHQLGVAPTQFQTRGAGSQQCMICHQVINKNLSHSIHTFPNCIGCHMPRIARSEESGDTHSHVFVTLLPKDTMQNSQVPNSCQTCHKHKDTDLKTLQDLYDGIVKKSLLKVHQNPQRW
jgi:hypothetical protein